MQAITFDVAPAVLLIFFHVVCLSSSCVSSLLCECVFWFVVSSDLLAHPNTCIQSTYPLHYKNPALSCCQYQIVYHLPLLDCCRPPHVWTMNRLHGLYLSLILTSVNWGLLDPSLLCCRNFPFSGGTLKYPQQKRNDTLNFRSYQHIWFTMNL